MAADPGTPGAQDARRVPAGDGLVAEIDDFEDRKLVLVEVEFTSEQQARAFVAPWWFGRDVTDDPAYKNRNLAS